VATLEGRVTSADSGRQCVTMSGPLKDELNSCFDLVVGRCAVGHNIVRVCWCDKLFLSESKMQNWPP